MGTEIWKPVVGFETVYLVSNFGALVKIKKSGKKLVYKAVHTKGYIRYALRNKGVVKYEYAHRLVAMAFVQNPNNKPHINHIDGVKTNNHSSNLEWCTPQENNEHGFSNGLLKRGRTIKPYVRKGYSGLCKVILDVETGIFYNSIELCALLGVNVKWLRRTLAEERKPNTTNYSYV